MGEKKPRVSYKTLYTKSHDLVNELKDKVGELGIYLERSQRDAAYWKEAYEKAYAERGVWAKMKEFFSL